MIVFPPVMRNFTSLSTLVVSGTAPATGFARENSVQIYQRVASFPSQIAKALAIRTDGDILSNSRIKGQLS